MFYINSSPIEWNKDDVPFYSIYLITQFYLPNDTERQTEIKDCLKKNLRNQGISHVYLLNEKIYTESELGVISDRLTQVNIRGRLNYKTAFDFVELEGLQGYIIISNSDIYFDESISLLVKSDVSSKKIFLALARYNINSSGSELDPNVSLSQDTWIYHTNFSPNVDMKTVTSFNLGTPGCDNKIAYLFAIFGYQVSNCCDQIRTYHLHQNDYRTYDRTSVIPSPYLAIEKNFCNKKSTSFDHENKLFLKWLESRISSKSNFLVTRIPGIELILSHFMFVNANKTEDDGQLYEHLMPTMKNNAGIKLETKSSALSYAKKQFMALKSSHLCLKWDHRDRVYSGIIKEQNGILKRLKCDTNWAHVLDIFNYINYQPWTTSLKRRRILIISPFVETFKKQLPHLREIYQTDLFPECSFIFLKPPQTNGQNQSREFDQELTEFIEEIRSVVDQFDIALCSCGGYGNLVCHEIYKIGKSAIYVGGVLQMYFGVLGNRWIEETPEIVKLYSNKYWCRPSCRDKPLDFEKIENGCYW